MAQVQRFLARRQGGKVVDIFIWTQQLADRGDLEEIYAGSVKEAMEKESMPDPKHMTMAQLEAMSKEDLLIFAKVKFGLDLAVSLTKDQIRDEIKQAWFTMGTDNTSSVGPAKSETAALAGPADVTSKSGLSAA